MDPTGELAELTEIYRQRGLDPALARQVAEQLTLHDALGAHAREELGLSETLRARPIQAALSSAASFAVGSVVPITAILLSPQRPGGPHGPRCPGCPGGRCVHPDGGAADALLGRHGHGPDGRGRPPVRRGQSMSLSPSPGAIRRRRAVRFRNVP